MKKDSSEKALADFHAGQARNAAADANDRRRKPCVVPLDADTAAERAAIDSENDFVGKPIGAGPVMRCLSDVEPVSVRWLWPGRIPLGKLTVLDGDPGLGKSMVTLDLAARVSRGDVMPDDSRGDLPEAACVLLLCAEDDAADTIRPRLDAARADVSKITKLYARRDARGTFQALTLDDVGIIEAAIQETKSKLFIVDPLMQFLPAACDSKSDQRVRAALGPLVDLAMRVGTAIVAVRHLRKMRGSAIYSGGGSIGIIGAARSGLLIGRDPDDASGDRRILAQVKTNLAGAVRALAYRVAARDDVPYVEWLGETAHTADRCVYLTIVLLCIH